MKVKVGDKIYDSAKEPIMVILTTHDKENIRKMPVEATKYCMYPDHHTFEEIYKWMDEV